MRSCNSRPLDVRKFAHLRIRAGIIDQRRKLGDFFLGAAIGFDRLDDRGEFGEFTRQLHVGVGSQIRWPDSLSTNAWRASRASIFCCGRTVKAAIPHRPAKVSSVWRMETLPTGCSRHGRRSSLRPSGSRGRAAAP